ncbi:hypothetical protein MTO96_016135 [Rhipicephalus appendiculatus]
MPGRPARRVRSDCNRAAPALSNLRGRVSFVKERYRFIQVEKPERASVYAHRSTIVNPRPKVPRNFGGLQEGDRVILDIEESPPQFKARYQAVRVQLEDFDADAAQHNSPPVPASGPEKAEKEIVNQVGTICSVDENGGTLRFGAENEECAVFDRRCVPNTLLKPTEKVSEIFSVGNKVGFNARLTNTGAGAAQWQATMATTVLRGNTSQVFVFDADITTCVRRDGKKQIGDKLIYVPFEDDPRATFQSSQRCPSSIPSASPRSQFPSESRILATAASFLPSPARTDKSNASLVSNTSVTPFAPIVTQIGRENGPMAVGTRCPLSPESRTLSAESYLPVSSGTSNTSLVFDANVTPGILTPTVTQISSQNGASAVQLHGQLSSESRTAAIASSFPGPVRSNTSRASDTSVVATTSAPIITQNGTGNEFRTLFPASNQSDHAKAEGNNTSLFYDTNAAPRTCAPVVTRSSTAATESPDEGDGLTFVTQRCKPRWAIDISRSTTRANPAAPAGGRSIPAGAEQPPKTTSFEKTPRQGFPLAANSHGTDSTAVRRQAPRSGDQPPTTAGDHRRPASAVSVKQATRHHCGSHCGNGYVKPEECHPRGSTGTEARVSWSHGYHRRSRQYEVPPLASTVLFLPESEAPPVLFQTASVNV